MPKNEYIMQMQNEFFRSKYDDIPLLKCGSLTTTASLSAAHSSLAPTAKTTANLWHQNVTKSCK